MGWHSGTGYDCMTSLLNSFEALAILGDEEGPAEDMTNNKKKALKKKKTAEKPCAPSCVCCIKFCISSC